MEIKHNQCGFAYVEFVDRYNNKCSLEKSTLAFEDCIWLGCDEIGLKKIDHQGWQYVVLNDDADAGIYYIANNRMHLTQDNVRELIPILQKFLDTGNL